VRFIEFINKVSCIELDSSVEIVLSYIYDDDQEKRDNIRSILRMNTMSLDWFRPSRRVIALYPVFVVLYYEIRCPR
jgi:hypothetical protein